MADASSETIQIVIKDVQGNETNFRVKKHTKMYKVMDSYTEKAGKDPKACRFHFDGERILAEDTPGKLGMEDDDSIDVFLEQIGGAFQLGGLL